MPRYRFASAASTPRDSRGSVIEIEAFLQWNAECGLFPVKTSREPRKRPQKLDKNPIWIYCAWIEQNNSEKV